VAALPRNTGYFQTEHTWSDGVDERADGGSIVPVGCEIVDGFVWNAALNPLEQALLRRLVAKLIAVPHRHRDGVVQDERPHQPQDQLHLAVHDIRTVCNQTMHQLTIKHWLRCYVILAVMRHVYHSRLGLLCKLHLRRFVITYNQYNLIIIMLCRPDTPCLKDMDSPQCLLRGESISLTSYR